MLIIYVPVNYPLRPREQRVLRAKHLLRVLTGVERERGCHWDAGLDQGAKVGPCGCASDIRETVADFLAGLLFQCDQHTAWDDPADSTT